MTNQPDTAPGDALVASIAAGLLASGRYRGPRKRQQLIKEAFLLTDMIEAENARRSAEAEQRPVKPALPIFGARPPEYVQHDNWLGGLQLGRKKKERWSDPV